MGAWNDCLLGDVITLKRGYDLAHHQRRPGPFPIVSSSGVTDHHDEAKVKGPGVVTGRYGTLGEVYYIEEDYWPLNTSLYVQDFKGNDPRFVAYYLTQLNFVGQNAAGAVPGVNRNHLHAMRVSVPDLPTQRRIAGMLSTYDELIANNQRRIAILEEMARALYREWFVYFRAPGMSAEASAKADVVMGEDGMPEGWEARRLDEIALIRGGKQLEKEDIHDIGQYPVFGGNGIQGYASEATHEGFVIAFGRVGAYCGSIHWSYEGAWLNNNSSSIVPNHWRELVLQHLLEYNFNNLRGGAAQPFISNGSLASTEHVIPSKEIGGRFCAIIEPMRLQQVNLHKQTANLRRTRDLLLPRLMSGRVETQR